MNTPVDDPEYHNNNFLVAVAKHLGLDPKLITAINITGNGHDEPVTVTWEGFTIMDQEDFNEILKSVDLSKVSRSSM
jgi:hypothetical protein